MFDCRLMYSVYILQSEQFPDQMYVGFTRDLKERLFEHNNGYSEHTSKFEPWKIIFCCQFINKYKALEFEKYLKTASGKAFAKKRLL